MKQKISSRESKKVSKKPSNVINIRMPNHQQQQMQSAGDRRISYQSRKEENSKEHQRNQHATLTVISQNESGPQNTHTRGKTGSTQEEPSLVEPSIGLIDLDKAREQVVSGGQELEDME